jgi:hypothetical protein
MALGIDKALRSWRSGDEKCSALLLHAESDRALCAGTLYFFSEHFSLHYRYAANIRLPTPWIGHLRSQFCEDMTLFSSVG